MKPGDRLYCVKSFSIENGPHIHSWSDGRIYKVLSIDYEGYVIQAEWSDCWFENEDWFDDGFKDNFITLKELRRKKLKNIERRK